jgi:chitin disaccharide deacetylase
VVAARHNHTPPRLIVNADDYGLSPALNREILRCAHEGFLTSVSLIAGGYAADEAMAAIRHIKGGFGVGVHLALDTARPVADPMQIDTLVTKEGTFVPRSQLLRRLLRGLVRREHVHREWSAQIEKVIKAGIQPDHIDGHGHVHVFPGLTTIVTSLANRYGIRAVRLPLEPFWRGQVLGRIAGRFVLGGAALFAREQFKGKLDHPDFLLGFSTSGCYCEDLFIRDIGLIKNGQIAEAMFHPGPEEIDIPDFRTWGYRWSVDSSTIRSSHAKNRIAQLGVELMTFSELPHCMRQA